MTQIRLKRMKLQINFKVELNLFCIQVTSLLYNFLALGTNFFSDHFMIKFYFIRVRPFFKIFGAQPSICRAR